MYDIRLIFSAEMQIIVCHMNKLYKAVVTSTSDILNHHAACSMLLVILCDGLGLGLDWFHVSPIVSGKRLHLYMVVVVVVVKTSQGKLISFVIHAWPTF